MPRSGYSKYGRTATGQKRARLQSPPNKGAHCVARQRVYSRVLRRNVMRCRKFEGGRVGIRKPPQRKTSVRCQRRKKVYSQFFRKKVFRCAKYSHAERRMLLLGPGRAAPDMHVSYGQSTLFTPPPYAATAHDQSAVFSPFALLPANAASLHNKAKMYRRLSSQMRRLKPGAQSETMSRWPHDRPRRS